MDLQPPGRPDPVPSRIVEGPHDLSPLVDHAPLLQPQ